MIEKEKWAVNLCKYLCQAAKKLYRIPNKVKFPEPMSENGYNCHFPMREENGMFWFETRSEYLKDQVRHSCKVFDGIPSTPLEYRDRK